MIYEEEMIDDYDQDYVAEEGYGDVDGDMTDAEADADTFRNIGWGTDEDYGHFSDGEEFFYDHLERDHDEQYIPDCDD